MLKSFFPLLAAGLRILAGRDVAPHALVAHPLYGLLLLLLIEAMVALAEWRDVEGEVQFSAEHLVWSLAGALLTILLFTCCRRRMGDVLRLTLGWLTCWLPLTALQLSAWALLAHMPASASVLMAAAGWLVAIVPVFWVALMLGRFGMAQLRLSGRATVGLMIGLMTLDLGVGWLASLHPYWREAPVAQQPESRVAPKVFDDGLFYDQPVLLDDALQALPPQRPGVRDVYVVAVAGHGGQAVFDKEARLALAVLGKQFDSRGTLLLANRPDTTGPTPLATRTSVAAAIQAVGQRMDTREDLLVLYLSSHGSSSFELQLDQPPTDFEGLTPQWLAGELTQAGIQRRIVIVSACYSGGYVRPLANEDSLIMTAADSTHTSFGCSDDADLTWFGRALLTEVLPKTGDLESAYPMLQTLIQQWETRDKLTPSNPQFFIGPGLRTWLAHSRARILASERNP